MVHDITSVIK